MIKHLYYIKFHGRIIYIIRVKTSFLLRIRIFLSAFKYAVSSVHLSGTFTMYFTFAGFAYTFDYVFWRARKFPVQILSPWRLHRADSTVLLSRCLLPLAGTSFRVVKRLVHFRGIHKAKRREEVKELPIYVLLCSSTSTRLNTTNGRALYRSDILLSCHWWLAFFGNISNESKRNSRMKINSARYRVTLRTT